MSFAVFMAEFFTLVPVGFLWITLVHLLGGVFPMGSITWWVIIIAWYLSPYALRYRDWLWGKFHG